MITQFPNLADLRIVYTLARDYAERFFPTLEYRKLVFVPTEIDDVHDEISDREKVFEAPVHLVAFVAPEGETHPLTRFGLEQVRNIELQITVPHLIDASLATQDDDSKEVKLLAKIGDRIMFSGFVYDILEIHRDKMWANTDIPITFKMRAARYRADASKYAEKTDRVLQWTEREGSGW